jgi:sugar lactone lactonase YvrE
MPNHQQGWAVENHVTAFSLSENETPKTNTMNYPITSLLAGLALASTAFGKGIPNNAAADLVLGQPNFTTNTFPTPLPSANSLRDPRGVAIDPNTGKVFIADSANNRILRYSGTAALANGAAAELVFGAAVFDDAVPSTSQLGFRFPTGVFVDRIGRLWVADAGNNRVLCFNSASFLTSNFPFADKVLGQKLYTTNVAGTQKGEMKDPNGVWVDSTDRLWVADTGNQLIERFDAVSTKANGAFEDGIVRGTLGPNRAIKPISVSVSASGALFVADADGHRVLRYNNAASQTSGIPDAVLGQPTLNSTTPATTAAGMNFPRGVFVTPDDVLWVTDAENQRVTRFNNASTKASGAAADGVIGQASFTTNTAATSDRGLRFAGYQSIVDPSGNLWVPDAANHRVLRFPVDGTAPLLALTGKAPKPVKKVVTLKGTASDANGISLVQFRVGKGPLQTAVGTTTWKIKAMLKKGVNILTLFATDNAGNVSVNKVLKIKSK